MQALKEYSSSWASWTHHEDKPQLPKRRMEKQWQKFAENDEFIYI